MIGSHARASSANNFGACTAWPGMHHAPVACPGAASCEMHKWHSRCDAVAGEAPPA